MKHEEFSEMISRYHTAELGHRPNVVNMTIQVTDSCNLACTYCYQINKHHNFISVETGKKFIDMMLTESNGVQTYYTEPIEGIVLEFIGGEPLLAIDIIDELTDYFIAKLIELHHPALHRFRISICSNGVLYFNSKVQTYIKKHMNHLAFSVSVDGNQKLHDSCRIFPDGTGSYDMAIAAVHHYTQVLRGYMGSKMTIAPANVQYTYDAVVSMIENGYVEINLNCVYEEGWQIEHARILYVQLKRVADYLIDHNMTDTIFISMFVDSFFRPKYTDDLENWCGGDGRMIAVDYKGDIYPCIRYMESSLGSNREPLKIGNVNTGLLSTCKEQECSRCLKSIL